MRKLVLVVLSAIVLPLFFYSCEEETPKDEPAPVIEDTTTVHVVLTEEERENITTNKWIWEEMDVYYLWSSSMPEYEKSSINPHDYFSSVLFSSRDKWSYLAEDYKTWINSLQGISKSMGYSLALYWKDTEQSSIIGVVEFVYPNTPAADAGIKRGDIIGKINGTDMVLDNYTDLLFDTEHAAIKLGEYNDDGVFVLADTTITVDAEDIVENPVLHYEIIEKDNKKIGYLVYVGYISNFNEDLNVALAYFKNNSIDELVLDLRYNPGGDLGAANELCSSIAPTAVVDNQEVLVKYNWNSELQAYITSQAASDPSWNDNLRILFDNEVKNKLNLSKLYALTTGGSASASELTLIGLDPYMEVIKIGETTHGKYAASITIPDEDSLWALQPIVLKYSNADGVTDFASGFTPDYPVEDVLDFGFGDLDDPMLKKAVELIIGRTLTASDKSAIMRRDFGQVLGRGGRHKAIQDGILNVGNPFQ